MKVTLGILVDSSTIWEGLRDEKLPFKTARKVFKLTKQTAEELEFYRAKLNEIIEEVGERDANNNLIPLEDGNGIKVAEERMEEANTAVEKLSEVEINIDIEPFEEAELENMNLTVRQIGMIEHFM